MKGSLHIKCINIRKAAPRFSIVGLLVAGASSSTLAQTTYYNVSIPGDTATINSALIFTQAGTTSTGTGTFGGFLTLGGNGSVNRGISGYGASTGSTPNLMADVTASQTAAMSQLTLGSAPTYTIGSTSYYAFYFDLNEPQTSSGKYISLDSLTIYSSSVAPGTRQSPTVWATSLQDFTGTGTQSGTGYVGANPQVRWTMDDLASDSYTVTNDRSVLIDTGVLGNGSGTGDMFVMVPTSNFSSMSSSDYLYFYASFGGAGVIGTIDYSSNGGFAEVGIMTGGNLTFTSLPGGLPTPVPETSPNAVLGIGLAAAGWLRARRRSQTPSIPA